LIGSGGFARLQASAADPQSGFGAKMVRARRNE